MMTRKFTSGALSVLLAASTAALALAPDSGEVVQKGTQTDVQSTTVTIDANQLDMFVTNVGVFAYDKGNIRGKSDGLYFPNSYPMSDKTVIYDSGMWIGCTRANGFETDTLVTVAEYSQEFAPGPLGSDSGDPANRVYKIYKNHLDRVADGEQVPYHGDTVPLTADDYNEWPAAQGAPLGDDGTPWINELGADQMTYTVFNDGDADLHTNDAGATAPIGIEIRQTTFAFDRSDALGSVIFMKYELKYDENQAAPIENVYLSLWSDPDLGGAGDDFVGCNPDIGLGYCYNATNQDKAYGAIPPAVGYDFFQGPTNSYDLEWPPASGIVPEFLPMTSFNKYINGTDPHSFVESYNYMMGLNPDGTPLSNGTTYQMAGDPVAGTGEIDTDPADRRYMMSAGPFRMEPGQTTEVYAAVMAAQGTNRLSSITFLRYVDTFAQSAFDADFVVPEPPAAPNVTVETLDRQIILSWDDAAEATPGSYEFQGYNVWQGETITGPWTRLATYDVQDGVATVFQESFDPETGEIYSRPVQFGLDTGLERYLNITEDVNTWAGNVRLVNYHPYYYAVTAYNYDPTQTPNNLESSFNATALVATPNPSTNGTDYGVVMAEVAHTVGGGTGAVEVMVANPAAITGDDYSVTFIDTAWVEVIDDTVFVDHVDIIGYSLKNTSTGEVLIERGENVTADPNVSYPVTEGLVVSVENHPAVIAAGWEWLPDVEGAEQWLWGVDWGGPIFGGGGSLGADFFGSTLGLEDMKTIEWYLTDNQDDWSDAAVYRRDLGYDHVGIGTFPGSAWDVTVDPPRRLNVCFVEHDDPEDPAYTADNVWDPNGTLGAREYLFVMDSDYNGAVDYDNDAMWGPSADVLWAVWPNLLDDSQDFDVWLAGAPGTFRFIAAKPFAAGDDGDVFTISTTPADRSAVSYALSDIRVVPNPYYGHSYYETKSDVKIVKFVNLPETATIKIFNIAGDHVKTLEKTASMAHELSWDLKNTGGVFVASGVYVYYVEAEGHGDTFGKMAVMLEQERLKEY
jgi:hypothetical protein